MPAGVGVGKLGREEEVVCQRAPRSGDVTESVVFVKSSYILISIGNARYVAAAHGVAAFLTGNGFNLLTRVFEFLHEAL